MTSIRGAEPVFQGGALDPAGAAREFGGSRSFWRRLMDDGTLPYSRAGSKRLIPRDAIVAHLESKLVPAKPAGRKRRIA